MLRIPFRALVALLGAPEDASAVKKLLTLLGESGRFERLEQLGFLESRDHGLSLALKDNLYLESGGKSYRREGPMTVVAVHLYSEGHESYRGYEGELIDGVSFLATSAELRARLGPPAASGGGNIAAGRKWPFWDRFDYPEYSLRVQYASENGSISMLTLMAPSER